MQGVKNDEEPKQEASGDPSTEDQTPTRDEQLEGIQAFDRKPKEIRDYLDRFVIKQEQANSLSPVAVCDHYNHVEAVWRCNQFIRASLKPNVLLLGPTGVGKTFLMRNVAKLIGVPFVKADTTKFLETDKSDSVDDLVRDLVKAAEGDVELAQYGIIVDEIDKIISQSLVPVETFPDAEFESNLLKLMEETEVSLHSPQDMMGQMKAFMDMQKGGKPSKTSISTKNILFIVSGAFDQLAENVRKRLDLNELASDPRRRESPECRFGVTTFKSGDPETSLTGFEPNSWASFHVPRVA